MVCFPQNMTCVLCLLVPHPSRSCEQQNREDRSQLTVQRRTKTPDFRRHRPVACLWPTVVYFGLSQWYMLISEKMPKN